MKEFLSTLRFPFIQIKKGKITVVDEMPYSGSNSKALYDHIKKIGYTNIYLFDSKAYAKKTSKEKFQMKLDLMSSEIIISTHSALVFSKSQKLIQLWHGIPLKSMGLLDKGLGSQWERNSKKYFDMYDSYISSSTFYNTLLNSTIGVTGDKYKITGFPRNDLLFTKSKRPLEKVVGVTLEDKKVAFFLPTFRVGFENRVEGTSKEENIFGFNNFNMVEFDKFLAKNNIMFVAKLHPIEESYFKEKFKEYSFNNFKIIFSEDLKEKDTDLYTLLGCSDMVITDYSSVYFDFLLTQKPLLFINPDIEEYREKRGLILEPYDFWTPGPKVQEEESLKDEIIKLLQDKNYYKKEREQLCDIVHYYKDANSCERVWRFIKETYLV